MTVNNWQPLSRIDPASKTDKAFIVAALIGGVLFSLPLLLLMILGYYSFREMGFTKTRSWPRTILIGAVLAGFLFVVSKSVLSPISLVISNYIGGSDTQGIAQSWDITDIKVFLGFLAASIFMGGILEEYIYRGFLLNKIAALFSNPFAGWAISIVLTNFAFMAWHVHWGVRGMIFAFLMGITISLLYLAIGRRIVPLMIAHAGYDVIIFTSRYIEASSV
jgi:membrane protease YdiL (CAAX protease family)